MLTVFAMTQFLHFFAAEEPVSAESAAAKPTSSKVVVDGKEVAFEACNIGGNNCFKLRDIAEGADFNVTWDAMTGGL